MYTSITKIFALTILSSFLLAATACKKFVSVPVPDHLVTGPVVFSSDASALSALSGIYSDIMGTSSAFSSSTTLYSSLAADDLSYFSTGIIEEFQRNEISQSNHSLLETNFWNPIYKFIYSANSCIEGATVSTALSQPIKSMVIGEAKFIRAFCYLHLVNLFGDCPLILSTDFASTIKLSRAPINVVYNQIKSDLADAEFLLTSVYPTTERIRPNKFAAAALSARVNLYTDNWAAAESAATSVITGSTFYTLVPNPSNVFLKNSSETIWQLQAINPVINTWEGNAILPASANSIPTYTITPTLFNSFTPGDLRKASWINSRVYQSQTIYYPAKYKVYGNSAPITEYYMVLRLAEQYLIRAEARVHLNNFSGALADINIIRSRAGLSNSTANNEVSLLDAIQQERRNEFFAEWGHRWFDLKRSGKADAVLSLLKPQTWQATDKLWPIPQNQILLNSALIQNPGY